MDDHKIDHKELSDECVNKSRLEAPRSPMYFSLD